MRELTPYALVLRESTLEREFITPVAVTVAAAALPELQGAGMVRDLREAVSLDSTGRLAPALTAYSSATTRSGQLALIDDVIKAWGETSTMKTSLDIARSYDPTAVIPPDFDLHPENFDWLDAKDRPLNAILSFRLSHPDIYHKIIALERFNGATLLEHWLIQVPTGSGNMIGAPMSVLVYTPEQEALAQNSYSLLRDYVYQGLVFQTRLKPYADAIGVVVSNGQFALDFSPVEAMLAQKLTGDAVNGLTDIIEFVKYGQGMFTGSSWDGYGYLLNTLRSVPMTDAVQGVLTEFNVRMDGAAGTAINGTGKDDITLGQGGNDILYGRAGDDLLFGEAGNDTLYGDVGNDTLVGGAGNDYVFGGTGNDILSGGAGSDYLDGGDGNDVYLFGRGAGQDTIVNYELTAGKVDAIQFAADVLPADVALSRLGDSLVLSINGSTDTLTVSAYFSTDATGPYKIEQIKFADGTVWDVNAVKVLAVTGTAGADTLTGYATADTLNGQGGNDILYGRAGDDLLFGEAGNDTLYGDVGNDTLGGGAGNDYVFGGTGNDILSGGAGSDYLDGGDGNDVYLFGRGAGQDTIASYELTSGHSDVLSLGNDISTDQLWFRRVGSNLEVSIIGTEDKATISGWYAGSAYRVEQFKTANGKMLLDSQVENLVSAMAAFAPPSAGQTDRKSVV